MFNIGQIIKTRLTKAQLQALDLQGEWLRVAMGPFRVYAIDRGYRNSEVLYRISPPHENQGFYAVWGNESDFYQDNECIALEAAESGE